MKDQKLNQSFKMLVLNFKLGFALCALIFALFTNLSEVQAQTVDPLAWQQNAQGLNINQDASRRTAGLEVIIKADSQWPFFSLKGGVHRYYGALAERSGIDLGLIRIPGQTGNVTNQTVDWSHNKITFGSDLNVWGSRLSPAILTQTQSSDIQFLSGNVRQVRYVDGVVTDYSAITQAPSLPKYMAYQTVNGVTVQPLGPTSPDLSQMSENWILVWYGNNSHFADTKKPSSYTSTMDGRQDWDIASLPQSEGYQADAPILIRFENRPQSITQSTTEGGITVNFGGSSAGYTSLLPLFGREHLKAIDTEGWSSNLPQSVVNKINTWTNYLCFYPESVSETSGFLSGTATFTENVTFIQTCSQGIKLAPIPPVIAVASEVLPINFSGTVTPTNTHSEYGPIVGIEDNNTTRLTSSYTWSFGGLNKYTESSQVLQSGVIPADLQPKLANEINKLFDFNGNPIHFDPWIVPDQVPTGTAIGYTYWTNPADTLYHLIEVAPVLPVDLQDKLRLYVQREKQQYSPDIVFKLNYGLGQQRSPFAISDPAVYALRDTETAHAHSLGFNSSVPLYNFYALEKYFSFTGEQVDQNTWDRALTVFDAAMSEQDWATLYWFKGKDAKPSLAVENINRHLAGLIGIVKLAKARNDTATFDLAQTAFAKAAVLRAAMAHYPRYYEANSLLEYPTNPNWQPIYSAGKWHGHIWKYNWTTSAQDHRQVRDLSQFKLDLYDHSSRDMNQVGPNPYLITFKDMVPEIGRFLRDNVKTETEIFIDNYLENYPQWFYSFAESGLAREHSLNHPVDAFQIFLAKAWIKGDSADQLHKYTDIPWLDTGDLFYIQKLAETIKAYQGWAWSDTLTVGPCTLVSSNWSPTTTTEGNTVDLNLSTTGNCSGQQATITISKNGLCGGDLTPAIPVTLSSVNTTTTSWTAQYTSDLCGLPGSPNQYYFTAVLGTQTLNSSGTMLSVSSAPVPIVNLITNGDFETGNLISWTVNGNTTVTTSLVHTGAYAAHSLSGGINRNISVTPGHTYRVTAWVYLNSITGGTWGGPEIRIYGFSAAPSYRETGYFQGFMPYQTWTKVSYAWTADSNSNNIDISNQGDRVVDFLIDDVQVFEKPAINTLPTISSLSVSPSTITTMGTLVSFTQTSQDYDGAIRNFAWDFGDGGHSNLPNPSYAYVSNGTYQVKLTVADDDGAVTTQTTQVVVNDPNYPTISISNPPAQVSQPSIALSGTASGNSLSAVTWSNDRGGSGTATGTTSWIANIPLQGGKNRILINTKDSASHAAKAEAVVWYQPSQTVSIGTIAANSNTVEQYDKLELTFPINNSVATNPNFPYETNSPAGIEPRAGITVNGEFSQDNFATTIVQPGFLYQDYERSDLGNQDRLYPNGSPVWKVRFAPLSQGNWQYRISVQDDSGSATSNTGSFTVVAPMDPSNHGFIKVASNDKRYFEFSDGTPYLPLGPAPQPGSDTFTFDTDLAKIGTASANFARPWWGGGIYGSAWTPWYQNLPMDGTVPASGLTTEQAFGDSLFSVKLSAASNQCMWQGLWPGMGITQGLKPNANYRITVRAKLIGVDSAANAAYPYGLTVRRTAAFPNGCNSWLTNPIDQGKPTAPITMSNGLTHQIGTADWQVYSGDFTNDERNVLGNLHVRLENAFFGTVYIDEVSVREILADGSLGSEVLRKPKMGYEKYFDQNYSFFWDKAIEIASKYGVYFKPVIAEKQDTAYNLLAPGGFGDSYSGHFDDFQGANAEYQKYYWRYLTARYGYSRNIHSWELANEQAPGNLWHGNELAKYIHQIDPNRHMVSTSFWSGVTDGLGNYFWRDPQFADIDYADVHAYVPGTSWFNPRDIDPVSGGNIVNDSALYTQAFSMDIYNRNATGGKPIIRGESGINNPAIGTDAENPAVVLDTQGVWYHKFVWGQINPGAMSDPNWWYSGNHLFRNNFTMLNNGVRPFVAFMKDIPLTNGHYVDAVATTSNTNIRAWGQKDLTLGRAHLWIDNRTDAWNNVVNNPSAVVSQSGTVTIPGMSQGTYTASWYDTYAGTVSRTENINVGTDGVATLTVTNLGTDTAVKLTNQSISPSCTLTSATWNSPTTVTQGGSATLTVNTTGSCTGQQVNLTITKNGLCGGALTNTTITPNPLTLTSSNTATSSWTSEYTSDICGLPGSPNDYYFTAVLGTQTLNSSGTMLSVSPAVTPTPTPAPSSVPASDWPQLQRDPQRTGYSPVQINPNFSLKWKWNTDNATAVRSSMKTQPIAAGGKVFFGSYDGKMYAIDANATGGNIANTIWSYQTGGAILNAAAYDNNKVYFGSDDGYFYAVDANSTDPNGTLLWRYQTGAGIWTAPLVVNNIVYFGSRDGTFYALNANPTNPSDPSSILRWKYDTGSPILGSAAYSAKQNLVYFGSENMNVYALNADTGAIPTGTSWPKKVYGESFRDSWPVVHEGSNIVFFTTMPQYPFQNQRGSGNPQLSTSSATLENSQQRQFYVNNPDRVTFFALDSVTGNDKYTQPVGMFYTSGSGGSPTAPVINGAGDVYLTTRSGVNNLYYDASSCVLTDDRCAAALGKLDVTTGDITPLVPTPRNTFSQSIRFVADEASVLSLSGSNLMLSMSQSVGVIDPVTGNHNHIIHEKQPALDNRGYGTTLSIFGSPETSKYSTENTGGHVAPPYGPAIVANGLIIWRADGGALAGVAGQ